MDIKIIGEHLEVTESIQNYIKNKFATIHKPEKLNRVEFRLGTTKQQQYVHFHAFCPHSEDIVIKNEQKNLYTAIDQVMEKIHRSFTKEKTKKNIHLM
jgi:putative sigma-54 modulation protein